jgi:hypothetical protein
MIHVLLMDVVAGAASGWCNNSPELSLHLSGPWYSFGDTLIIAVTVQIPEGFVLVGNPTGPGIGRPSKIRILSADRGIRWVEVRKMDAEKYGPPFGDWVWVYRHEAVFFCKGIIVQKGSVAPVHFEGVVEFEGLLCRNECRFAVWKAPFSLTITDKQSETVRFGSAVSLREMFGKSKPMMVLEQIDR